MDASDGCDPGTRSDWSELDGPIGRVRSADTTSVRSLRDADFGPDDARARDIMSRGRFVILLDDVTWLSLPKDLLLKHTVYGYFSVWRVRDWSLVSTTTSSC